MYSKIINTTKKQIDQAKEQCLKDMKVLEQEKDAYGYQNIPLKLFAKLSFMNKLVDSLEDCVKQSQALYIHAKFCHLLEWYKELCLM
jgi:hypothetical protein